MASVRLPAYCPKCGMVFPSNTIITVAPGASGTFRYNAEVCRFCGALAYIADATFKTVAGEVLAAVKAPGVTRPMLLAFRLAAVKAYQEQQPPGVFAAEVEQISPALAAVVRKSADWGFYRGALLLIILAAIHSTKFDLNQFIDQVMYYMTSPKVICAASDPPPELPAADLEPPPDRPEMEPRRDQPPP